MKIIIGYFLIGLVSNLICIAFLKVKYETKTEFMSGVIFWPVMYLYFLLFAIKRLVVK